MGSQCPRCVAASSLLRQRSESGMWRGRGHCAVVRDVLRLLGGPLQTSLREIVTNLSKYTTPEQLFGDTFRLVNGLRMYASALEVCLVERASERECVMLLRGDLQGSQPGVAAQMVSAADATDSAMRGLRSAFEKV